MGKVIKKFRDKLTKKTYQKGDSYSHDSEDRIAFLVEKGFLERSQHPLENEVTHVGGGWYELSNGEKVKGKEAAEKAAKEL